MNIKKTKLMRRVIDTKFKSAISIKPSLFILAGKKSYSGKALFLYHRL